MKDEEIEKVLERVDPARREFMRRVILGTAYAIPTVGSFALDGLSVYEASAMQANS